jgi:hypothetical protein
MKQLVFVLSLLCWIGCQKGSGRFPIHKDNKIGFIDNLGKIVIEPIFEDVHPFSEGLAAVKLNGDI